MGAGNADNDFISETYRRSPALSKGEVSVYSFVVRRAGSPEIHRGRVTRVPRNQAPAARRWVAQGPDGRIGHGPRRDKAIAAMLDSATDHSVQS